MARGWPKGKPRSEETIAKIRARNKKELPEDEIISAYIGDKQSLASVAEKYNVSPNTVTRLLQRNGIKRRSRNEKIYSLEKDFLIHEYVENKKSGAQIAREFGCSDNTVLVYLHEYGISVSKSGDRAVSRRPEIRAMHSMRFRGCNNPMKRPEVREKMIARLHSPEIVKLKSINSSGPKNAMWRGGISYEPYCPKFNDGFKARVRAFFGNMCLICGKSAVENGEKLAVHHVAYNKETCCDESIPMFAPLCKQCHCKTNHNRDSWEYMLSYIIQCVYGGQSFLPKQ